MAVSYFSAKPGDNEPWNNGVCFTDCIETCLLLFPKFSITPEDEESLRTVSSIPSLFFLLTATFFVVQGMGPLDFGSNVSGKVSGEVSVKKVVHISLSVFLSHY